MSKSRRLASRSLVHGDVCCHRDIVISVRDSLINCPLSSTVPFAQVVRLDAFFGGEDDDRNCALRYRQTQRFLEL